MKYYSEILDQLFDNSEQLLDAEMAHVNKLEKEAEERKAKENALTNRKKELAKNIELCEANLDVAYKQLEEVRLSAQSVIDAATKKAEEMLKPAIDNVNTLHKDRVRAISAFNKEFGPFKTTYTGDKAQQEVDRVNKLFKTLFNPLGF